METGDHHHDEEELLSEALVLTSSQSTHLQTQEPEKYESKAKLKGSFL